jgi:hypothetical protein
MSNELIRTTPEEQYKYDLGPPIPTTFLTAEHSHITPGAASNLYNSRLKKK